MVGAHRRIEADSTNADEPELNDVSGSSWVLVHASHAKEQNFRAWEAGGLTGNRRCLFRPADSSMVAGLDKGRLANVRSLKPDISDKYVEPWAYQRNKSLRIHVTVGRILQDPRDSFACL
jgi:hypothetical protein